MICNLTCTDADKAVETLHVLYTVPYYYAVTSSLIFNVPAVIPEVYYLSF
jgi:hypothetical protein